MARVALFGATGSRVGRMTSGLVPPSPLSLIMGMCNVVARRIRKTVSRTLVPDYELDIQRTLLVAMLCLGHVTYYRWCRTRDAIMAKTLMNLYWWTWANLKVDWICSYSCNLRLICASIQATRLQWNSEESLFNSCLLQLPTLATCPAAQVLSPEPQLIL
jgi:hypothetical protein